MNAKIKHAKTWQKEVHKTVLEKRQLKTTQSTVKRVRETQKRQKSKHGENCTHN